MPITSDQIGSDPIYSLLFYITLREADDDLVMVLQVGNEFGSVEALWSQFENFMGSRPGEEQKGGAGAGGAGGGVGGGQHQDDDEEGSQLQEEDHR